MRASSFLALAVALSAVSVFFSCSSPYHDSKDPPIDPGSGGAHVDELFVDEMDEYGEAYLDFDIADSAYICPRGYTLWSLKAEPQAEFSSRSVELTKLSGYGATGFGIVFCHHGAEDPNDETMLVAMINTQREYIVGEARGSVFEPFDEWKEAESLKSGYVTTNTMRIDLNREARLFTLYLNDVEICTFTPSDVDYELGGSNGYIAVISPYDQFPKTPVHITYKDL